jgi:hypothetical protein
MKRTIALLLLVAARWPSAASAQPPPDARPTVITLRPVAEPVPALKYRLVPEQIKLVPGNAAIFYHRGIIMMMETYAGLALTKRARPDAVADRVADRVATGDWVTGPIGEIQRDKARKYLEPFENALKEVELGALRSTCDWEFDQRTEGMYLLLPEIQDMRGLARLVALKARLAILDGKTDDAVHWIETAFVMGRHVSQGPLAIQALVGISIGRTNARYLEELIQAPGGPSLYWALADRPRPFIDMRRPMEGERYLLEKEVPELSELDRGAWSLDQARRFADTLQRKLFALASGRPIVGGDGAVPMDFPGLSRRLGIAAMAAKVYPEAKRALIAQGRPEIQVEAMPVIQVAALYTMQEYQRLRDDAYKWMNVPYWQSYNRIEQANQFTAEQRLANPLLVMIYDLLSPARNAPRFAPIRLERELDALQCIEAIRLYAAAHDGKLPPTLEAITDAPAPLDPATGKPFLYQMNGDSATLSALASRGFNYPHVVDDHQPYAIRYELKLAK